MLASLISEVRYRWRALFGRAALEQELDEELQFHLQQATERLVHSGMPQDAAARQARLDLGGVEVIKEASRDRRGITWVELAGQDLRYALRSLRRHPGFTLGVTLTLALGIGVNAAMFGIVDQLLFRAPPFMPEPSRVHRIYLQWTDRDGPRTEDNYQYTRYLDLQRWTTSFSELAAYGTRDAAVGTGTASRERPIVTASAAYFNLFDAPPALGRYFTAQEDTVPVGAMVAVLGYGFWQAEYGGRADALGQQIHVGSVDYTIIGVAPRGFVGLADRAPPAVYLPITSFAGTFRGGAAQTNYYTRYNWGWMMVVGRRKPDVSLPAADADLSQAFARSWENERSLDPRVTPAAVARPHALAGPIQFERGPNRSAVTRVAGWVSGVAGIVLIIACANVANLLLARSIRRRREIAVRLALGVSRRRLIGQLFTETALLALGGALAGLLLAHWGGLVLGGLFIPQPVYESSFGDGRTLAFVFVAAMLVGWLTGFAPMLQTRRADLAGDLKAGVREGGQRRSRLRTTLLLLQAALSVVLLIGALLFVKSLEKVHALRLGYDADSVLYVSFNMRGTRLAKAEAITLRQRVVEAARGVPGVEQAALGLTVPFWDIWVEPLFVAGIDSVDRLGSFTLQGGSPEYFGTFGTRILRGRGVTEQDVAGSPPVAVVSAAMAERLWPGREALGQCMRIGADTSPCTTIVGVAENVRQNSLSGDPAYHYYLPIGQYQPEAAVVFARVHGDALTLKEAVRRALQPLMPGDSYLTVTAMQEIVGSQTQSWRTGATMFLAFGGLALLLAAIGLYSVIAYDVAQRNHELGIRIALGAGLGDVVRLVVGDGLRVALLGVTIGGGVALAAARWIAPLLFDQSPTDPVVFGMVAGVLLLTALLASAIPALRAVRIDPTEALRTE